jgi:hypothetical protein
MAFKRKWVLMVSQWLFGRAQGEKEKVIFHSNQKV